MGHDSDRVVNKKKHHVESCWVDAVYSESATHHIYIYIRLNLGPRSQERPKDHEDRVARARRTSRWLAWGMAKVCKVPVKMQASYESCVLVHLILVISSRYAVLD